MLEHRILNEEPGYGPGWVLPPAPELARGLGLGPRTVRDAYRLLATMGLVYSRSGYGATVRTPRDDMQVITAPAGTVVETRMPTFDEMDRWGLEPGTPMLVVDGQPYPGDRYVIRFATES